MATGLFVVGVNQRSADTCMREQMHVELGTIYKGLRRLREKPRVVAASAPLITCERTEIYGVGPDPERARRLLIRLAVEESGTPRDLFLQHTYLLTGEDAVRHLFRVASGLDSVIHGESQILGQVRAALMHPETDSVASSFLKRLFQSALSAGKRVRSETGIGQGSASVAGAALCLLEAKMHGIEGRRALVLGAGETGTLVAKLLHKHGVHDLVVANRTVERAAALADELGVASSGLDEIDSWIGGVDVIVGAVGGRDDLITPEMLRKRATSTDRPLYLLDLSHPRTFAAELGEIPGVELLDLERIFARVEQARDARAAEVPRAEAIVDAEVENFLVWDRSRTSAPVLRAMREQVLALAQAEAEKRSTGRPEAEREEFARLARSIARTFLHGPTMALRDADPATDEGRWLLEHLPSVLGVDPEPVGREWIE